MAVDISLIVPAFNERYRIGATLEAFDERLRGGKLSYELLVVDDGSTDDTIGFVDRLRASIPNLRILSYQPNRGKGYAVRQGMLQARGHFRVMCDADGSTPPDQLADLLGAISSGQADISIGSRYIEGAVIETPQPWFRRIWSRTANWWIQRALLPGIVDTHCGFKAFTEEAAIQVFGQCTVDGWAFDLEALVLAQAQGFVISEVPVRWADDARSRGRASHLLRAASDLWHIRKRMFRNHL